MKTHSELRVHGVSGTPPREMLYTDPVTLDPSSEHTRIYRRRPPDRTDDAGGVTHQFETEAFHWGSLTTGHWLTAFWILLGPFAFANVAGWMSTRPNRLTHVTVRLVGVALTALFVVQLGYVFLEIVPSLAPSGWRRGVLLVSAVVYPAVFVVGVVIWLSTQTHFNGFDPGQRIRLTMSPLRRHLLPPRFWDNVEVARAQGQWDDPAGSPVTSPVLWREHAILHRIRRLHLVAGVGVVTALLAAGLELVWLKLLAIGIAVVAILLTALTTTHPRSTLVQVSTAWAPVLSVIGLGLAYWQLVVSGVPAAPWPGIHVTTFVVALALGATALGAVSAGLLSLGAVVIGGLFGASLGVGVGLIGERYARIDQLTDNGAGWVAVAMLFLVVTLAITALLLSLRGDPLPREGRAMAMLRRVTSRSRLILVVAALFGLVAGVVAFAAGCADTCTPDTLVTPGRGSVLYPLASALFGLAVVLLAVAVWQVRRSVAPIVALIGGSLVFLFATGRLPSGSFAGFAVDYADLVDVSKVLVIVLPATLVLRSMVGSIRRGTSNRQVGILWDVASMWPRWFHPLAPPSYGPKVIESLTGLVKTNPPDLFEAHSQGSVIAALTVTRLDDVGEMSMLTYGSPLGLLYPQMFPAVGIESMVAEVEARLGGRWVNLWRDTDPLGGMPIGLSGGDTRVRDGTGHSGYELSADFVDARHRLT
jgi:hypothetical protein